MARAVNTVVTIATPKGAIAPVVLDSPHSGHRYPPDFLFACPELALRQTEDSFVDELFSHAPKHGATLVAAQFPRAYIDVNRAEDDIDPQLLAAPWPRPIRPSEKSRVGMGLVRRICRPGMPVYSRKLTPREIQMRIDTYYRPYHAALTTAIQESLDRFGTVWHLNCHSMPSAAVATSGGWDQADFVLGDRDGTTCEPEFTRFIAGHLENTGYSVRLNDPYKGVEIVRRYGRPAYGIHSLQIEISRKLYMNEETVAQIPAFAKLKRHMTELVEAVAAYGEMRLLSNAAD